MSSVRQHLRRAAEDFAEQVYNLLRADLLADLRREVAADAARRGAPPKPERQRRRVPRQHSATPLERVLIYVAEHPGTKPKAIIEATGMGRPAVFAALASACATGALVKEGSWRNVTYSPAGHTPSDCEVAAAPKPKYRRSRIGAADILEDVVAWVERHPGCRRSELTPAFPVTGGVLRGALDVAKERGRLRMEGTRAAARYFAQGAPACSVLGHHDAVVTSVAATR